MKNKTIMSLRISTIALAVSHAFAGTAVAQEAKDNTVVVSGIRASARSAVAIKRDAMEVVDSITAEDIGKLPDPNVSETLTRIPGVQGYRYGGEGASPVGMGSGITIRGLSGQTGSQVNGRSYFTAGNREFNIEDAIPSMIAGIDVYKNPTAEHIEGGIGGLVNVRTRNPSDFKGLTVSLGVGGRENTLAKKANPELFGLIANKWDLGGGSRFGVMAAATYQTSTGRSDATPANGGASLKRAVRADSAEYAALAAANKSNSPAQPMAAYVGRSDINYLASVPLLPVSATVGANTPNLAGLSAEQIGNVMTSTGTSHNIQEETILRTRKGLNLAADYRVNNTLRAYSEFNYTYYQYNQQGRFLNTVDGANIQNLQTAPFSFTEALANRNSNGGSNDVLAGKRLVSGSFLDSAINTTGNNARRPYTTWIGAGGVEWSPTPQLSLKADFNYIKSDLTDEGPAATIDSAPGLTWSVNRVADGAPHQMTFTGPSLGDPKNFVLRSFASAKSTTDDSGYASALSGAYVLDDSMFTRLKFGTRFAQQQSAFSNFTFPEKFLTTDNLPLNATKSNGVPATTVANMLMQSPPNFLGGQGGYAGGFAVVSADQLTGNTYANTFPKAGIPLQGAYIENVPARRFIEEKTSAAYLMGDFSALDDRIKGNLGLRVVRTNSRAIAQVANTLTAAGGYVANEKRTSYTNALPSLNVSADITADTLVRFAYGRGMTRAPLDALNPSVSVNFGNGTASQGNADLRPLTANSIDLSLEKYFSKTNYVSAAVFNKQIKGFVNGIAECRTVETAQPYTGSLPNGCGNGQYLVTRSINTEDGYARGVELAGQWFFDGSQSLLKNFGVGASYSYVDTSNPVNFGTPAAPRLVDTPQPMQSKNNFSVSGMYEDNKLSARLVYTWRSESILFGVSTNPIDGRYIGAYGILDGSVNYNLDDKLTLSFSASNLTNKGLDRFIGESGAGLQTGIERQHYLNGRTFGLALRYKFGK
ncbi:TonB-dependent receptor [Pseudoduganella rivuli]|nr:TonB-dependent receptor [Pseudoduganella rivuli]